MATTNTSCTIKSAISSLQCSVRKCAVAWSSDQSERIIVHNWLVLDESAIREAARTWGEIYAVGSGFASFAVSITQIVGQLNEWTSALGTLVTFFSILRFELILEYQFRPFLRRCWSPGPCQKAMSIKMSGKKALSLNRRGTQRP